MPNDWQAGVNERLDVIIDAPGAPRLAEAFFDPDGPFAGASFVTLEQDSSDPDRIGIADLLAVTFLDVALRPAAVRSILGADADELQAMLTDITPRDIWAATDSDFRAAEQMFNRLKRFPFVGEVIAGKLLARKRPRLIPVVDRTVEHAVMAPPGRYWIAFRDALQDEDRRRRVERLRPSNLDPGFPLLRILDAVLWMTHSGSGNAKKERGSLS